jgi:4,5-DOPA dioxygenase extradiol
MAIDTSYVQRFSGWIAQQLDERNTEALLDYRQQHPDAMQAQPRDEHLLPLFTALGAAGPEAHSRTVHRGISDHVIAMDSYAFERD